VVNSVICAMQRILRNVELLLQNAEANCCPSMLPRVSPALCINPSRNVVLNAPRCPNTNTLRDCITVQVRLDSIPTSPCSFPIVMCLVVPRSSSQSVFSIESLLLSLISPFSIPRCSLTGSSRVFALFRTVSPSCSMILRKNLTAAGNISSS